MKRLLYVLVTILFLSPSFNATATEQFPEWIIVNGDTTTLQSLPFEPYLDTKPTRVIGGEALTANCTALYRGYVATWKIENDQLFLTRLETNYCSDDHIEIDINAEFGINQPFASWYSGELRVQGGRCLSNSGFRSIFEKESIYEIKAGKVLSRKDTTYLEWDNAKISPEPRFLRDTITYLIYQQLDSNAIAQLPEDGMCELTVAFDKEGFIESPLADGGSEKGKFTLMMQAVADSALKGFPQLMTVRHASYLSPYLTFWFNAHCLQYPADASYGCEDYRSYEVTTSSPAPVSETSETLAEEVSEKKEKRIAPLFTLGFIVAAVVAAIWIVVKRLVKVRKAKKG